MLDEADSSKPKRCVRIRTHPVLSDHDLFDQLARSDLDAIDLLERTCNLPTRDQGEPLDALKVGVLDGHDAVLGEEGLGVVVDELSVDEAGDAVRGDLGDFGFHFLLLEREERLGNGGDKVVKGDEGGGSKGRKGREGMREGSRHRRIEEGSRREQECPEEHEKGVGSRGERRRWFEQEEQGRFRVKKDGSR
jgi:hypothetical protein